jgi:hypothetical protein
MKGRVMERDESADISNIMIQITANGSTGASNTNKLNKQINNEIYNTQT